MKLAELHLCEFGPFADHSVALAGGLTILYGHNEAGKSTLLRAIRAAFFGASTHRIGGGRVNNLDGWSPTRPGTRLRVAAELDDGQVLTFTRANRSKSPVEGQLAGISFDANKLSDLLDIDAIEYRNIYGFSLDELRDGQQSLTDANVSEVLFGGGLGRLAQFRQLQTEVAKRADALFLPRGKKPPINEHLLAVHRVASTLRQKTVAPREFSEREAAIEAAASGAAEAEQSAATLQTKLSRLEQLDQADAYLNERNRLLAEQRSLDLEEPLPESALDEVRSLLEDLQRLPPVAEELRKRLASYQSEIDALPRFDDHERVGNELEALLKRADRFCDSYAAVESCSLELDEITSELANMGGPPDEAAAAPLPADATNRLAAWREQRDALGEKRQQVVAQRNSVEYQIVELEERLSSSVDLAREAALIALGEKWGDLQRNRQQRETLRSDIAAEKLLLKQLDQSLASVVVCDDISAASERVPTNTQVDEAIAKLQEIESERTIAEESVARLQEERQRFSDDLDVIRSNPHLVTAEQLQQSRDRRDELVRQLEESGADSAATDGPSIHSVMIIALQQAITKSDELADRIAACAQDAAREAELQKRIAFVDRDLVLAESKLAEHVEAKRSAEEEWSSIWPDGFRKKPTVRTAQAWTNQFYDLKSRLADLEQQKQALAEEDCEAAHVVREVRAFVPDSLGDASDESLIAWLENEVVEIGERRSERRQSERAQPALKAKLQQASSAIEEVDAELAEVDDEIATWQKEHGFASTLGFAELQQHVQSLIQSRQLRVRQQMAEQRRAAAQADIDGFLAGVSRVAEDLGESVSLKDPAEVSNWIAQEHTKLQRHREASVRSEGLARQVEQTQAEALETQRQITDAQEELASKVDGADHANHGELRSRFDRSTIYWQLQREIRKAEELLCIVTNADSLDDVVRELSESDAESRRQQRAILSETLAETRSEMKTLFDRAAVARDELNSLTDAERLSSIQLELEGHRASLRDAVEQFAPLVILQSLLRDAVDTFGRSVRPELLDSVGHLLGRLTDGDYVDIERSLEADALRIQHKDGVWKTPDELSTGTRELLYLAVRLAFVRQRTAAHESLPLVLDDVLVNIDTRRCLAVLRTLQELAGEMQVVLLTCRPELIRIAQMAGDNIAVTEFATGQLEEAVGITGLALEPTTESSSKRPKARKTAKKKRHAQAAAEQTGQTELFGGDQPAELER